MKDPRVRPPYGVLLFAINGLNGMPLHEMIAKTWPLPDAVLRLAHRFGHRG
jgi:hypothetical protein